LNYTVGFIFNETATDVLLIRKIKPRWQEGKFNGIGGKLEEFDETPLAGMIREAREESTVKSDAWEHVATLVLPNHDMVYFYALHGQELKNIYPLTDEGLHVISVKDIYNQNYYFYHEVIPNLRYLIQLALDTSLQKPVVLWEKESMG
jgi:8-oxo-dGTP diphosphatase